MYNRYAIDNTIFNIAIYIRLSREDGDDLESESVTNQRSLLIGYLKAQNLVAVDIYVDDGYTGTNFERPEFKRMLSDIENGKINMVITKDLSRLGRDHVMTGYYVETFFPQNDVRYIAVNDDIDTFLEISFAYISFIIALKGLISLLVLSRYVSIPSNIATYLTDFSGK